MTRFVASQNEIIDIQASNKRTKEQKCLADNHMYCHWVFYLNKNIDLHPHICKI